MTCPILKAHLIVKMTSPMVQAQLNGKNGWPYAPSRTYWQYLLAIMLQAQLIGKKWMALCLKHNLLAIMLQALLIGKNKMDDPMLHAHTNSCIHDRLCMDESQIFVLFSLLNISYLTLTQFFLLRFLLVTPARTHTKKS